MKTSTFAQIVKTIAKESKCISHQVGALLVKDDRIISHGYNGTAPGEINCCDHFPNPEYGQDGKLVPLQRTEHNKWSLEHEIHAEANCLIWAARNGISPVGADMYVTLSPCMDCCKLIKTAGVKNVYYLAQYDKGSTEWISNLEKSGIKVTKIEDIHD